MLTAKSKYGMNVFMKKLFLWCVFGLAVFASAYSFAGGDGVNNAGGSSELILVYAHQNFGSLTENCHREMACNFSPAEVSLFEKILQNLASEQVIRLQFKSDDSANRVVFSTLNWVGAPIVINNKLLGKVDDSGAWQSYLLSDALKLLARAFGQHHFEFAEPVVNSLAQKIAVQALVGKAFYVPLLSTANLNLLIVKNSKMDQMFLDDRDESFADLQKRILPMLPCQVSELSLYDFQWSHLELPHDEGPEILLNGRMGWKCIENSRTQYSASLNVRLLTQLDSSSLNKTGPSQLRRLRIKENSIKLILSKIEGRD